MRTERLELVSVAGRSGELGRDENPAAQRLAQGIDPRYLVDRRSDDREVEAIHRANIAIEHLAEVEREIDRGNRLPHPRSISVKLVEAVHCFGGGGERVATGFIAESQQRRQSSRACHRQGTSAPHRRVDAARLSTSRKYRRAFQQEPAQASRRLLE